MGDRARRHVAHVPAGLAQPPDQVHVLAAAERGVEEVGPRRHVHPDQQGRARHEGDAAPGADRARLHPTVQRRARQDRCSSACRSSGSLHDARCHRRHQRVVEVAEEGTEPPVGRHAVGVDEGDERAVDAGQPGVAGSGRADVGGERRPGAPRVARRSPWWRRRRPTRHRPRCRPGPPARRAAGRAGPAGRAPAPPRSRRRARGWSPAGSGANAPAETSRRASSCAGRRGPTGAPDLQRADQPAGPLGNPEQAQRAAAEQHGPAVEFPCRGVLGQGEGAGQRRRGPGGAGRSCGGHPGCAGLGHRPILAVRGRG